MNDLSKIFDGLLVLQYRSGTKKALNLLVNKYHNKLCKHSYWYTHDIEASKDIVQDCWSTIIMKLDNLKDPNLFGSWAFRIVTRKSLDYVKRKKRDIQHLQKFQQIPTTEEDSNSKEAKILQLRNAIRLLPEGQQIVLRLFYMEKYSLQQISKILNTSEGTVKSRLYHAREKLKTILK